MGESLNGTKGHSLGATEPPLALETRQEQAKQVDAASP